MAERKRPRSGTSRGPARRTGSPRQPLVLLGDARPSPVQVLENGQPVTPVIALWAVADGGLVWSTFVDVSGDPVRALVHALRNPVFPFTTGGAAAGVSEVSRVPDQIVLFDELLARRVQAELADPSIEIIIAPRFEPFEELFRSLIDTLTPRRPPVLPLPDKTLTALCAAGERLWRAKPWDYALDHPAIEVRSPEGGVNPLYASVLGANREVFGIAFYTSLNDYQRDAEQGQLRQMAGASLGLDRDDDAIDALLGSDPGEYARGGGRVLLFSFDPRSELHPDYVAQLTRAGWPKRLRVLPTLFARGDGEASDDPTAGEADALAPAVDAVVAFCQRHRAAITAAAFPIADSIAVRRGDETISLTLSMPPTR